MAALEVDVDALYASSRARMVSTAWMLLGSREAAEDAVQEAFARLAARGLSGLREPEAYLRTVVVNECRRAMRRRGRSRPDGDPEEVHLDHSHMEMREALDGLTHRRRTAVVLRFYEDMSVGDIAQVMGCRPSTVSSLLHRALRDLREVIDAEDR